MSSQYSSSLKEKSSSLLHHTKTGFTNPYLEKSNKSLFNFLWTYLSSQRPWGKGVEKSAHWTQPIDKKKVMSPDPSKAQAAWLGHSTVLVQCAGMNILMDPILSNYASPLAPFGPKRYTQPALALEDLPHIDYVLISHNHYDHLDLRTVRYIYKRFKSTFLLPLKLASWFQKQGIHRVLELDWWRSYELAKNIRVTCLPAQHWSKRSLFDDKQSLWCSWSVNFPGFSFYFAGDTGYNCHQFKEIGRRCGPFHLAAIPIGSYLPRVFMKNQHVNPQEALQIHEDIMSQLSFGIHWGTFILSQESADDPKKDLEKAYEERKKEKAELPVFLAGAIGSIWEMDS